MRSKVEVLVAALCTWGDHQKGRRPRARSQKDGVLCPQDHRISVQGAGGGRAPDPGAEGQPL